MSMSNAFNSMRGELYSKALTYTTGHMAVYVKNDTDCMNLIIKCFIKHYEKFRTFRHNF